MDPSSGETLDRGLAIWFPGPSSFTGEDVAEFHVHGGRAVIDGVIDALASLDGLRPAEAGEFTRRAFVNGKLDLTAAEGLADLVAAETAAQRRQALRQLGGALAALYESWREILITIMAHVEADIDFVDEGDVPDGLSGGLQARITELSGEMSAHLNDDRRGERLREGLYIAIVGPPNVGKSSLLNLLTRRDAAIVSATAGTTRDVIEAHFDIGGYPVTVADTAGLREVGDEIESEGVRRALVRAREADLKLMMLDATQLSHIDQAIMALIDEETLVLVNKVDLAGIGELLLPGVAVYPVSVRRGDGLDAFHDALQTAVAARLDVGVSAGITRVRHRVALEDSIAALSRALAADAVELIAEDLRLAARSLGRITGRVDVEDILDLVFAEFCIGK